jgi:hypothetical protein
MTEDNKFEYDVAFSFTQQDEGLAFAIKDLIQERYKAFIYSEQQKTLAGADGEKKFNEIFCEKARLVVVLYRADWGQTPWTRIEETAIRNRGHNEGYDFTTFVRLDDTQMPKWLPKTRIYYNFDRWGIQGLAPVVEARIEEAGGHSIPESISDRAERLKRLRNAEKEREIFLRNNEIFSIATKEFVTIIEKLKKHKDEIEDPSTNLLLNYSEKAYESYEFGHNGYYLSFVWDTQYSREISDSQLNVTLLKKSGHYPFDYKENKIKAKVYRFDRDLLGRNGWTDFATSKNFCTSDELIDKWVKIFIEHLSNLKKPRI